MNRNESYFGIEKGENYYSRYTCPKCNHGNISLKQMDVVPCARCDMVFVVERELLVKE
jgi:transcription elongation factor Elf1